MRFEQPVRVPLQTGSSALWAIVFTVPGVVMLAIGAVMLTQPVGVVLVGLGLLGMGALVLFACVSAARERRPSDVVFSANGIAIEGGARHGLSRTWDEIHTSAISLASPDWARQRRGDRASRVLTLTMDGLRIAESEQPEETATFAAVVDAIRAGVQTSDTPTSPAGPASVAVLTCAACGAPVVPVDDARAACRSCKADIEIPIDLRERVRVARTASREHAHAQAMTTRLLEMPGATRTNALLAATAVGIYALLPILMTTGTTAHRGVAVTAAMGIVVVLALTRCELASRTALRALILGFAARAPRDADDPYTCRRCGAPLPEAAAGEVVVRCVYCRCANVLGIDLRAEAEKAHSDDLELTTALAARVTAERWRAGVVGLALVVAVVAVVMELRGGFAS